MVNALIARELASGFAIEGGYIGRFGRDLLVRRDMAMPLNLVDTRSGMDYFTAVQTLIRATQAAGIPAGAAFAAYGAVPNMAYWENLFPGAAGNGISATQAIARAFNRNAPDYITAIYDMDESCSPACSIFGPYRVLRGPVRLAGGNQLARSVQLPRHDREPAQAVQSRLSVRRELHAGEIGRHGIERRTRQLIWQFRRGRQLGLPRQLVRS